MHPARFRDRVYVSWTRFLFNPVNGSYVQSPIFFAFSSDGGQTFSDPQNISGNVLYDQGSRPIVAYDGTVYVIFEGAQRLSTLDSTYIVKSTNGGVTFSKPVKVADVQDVIPLANTAFRVNSFPAGAAAPNGDLYVAWSTLMSNAGGLAQRARTPTATRPLSTANRWTVARPGLPPYRSSPRLTHPTALRSGYPAPDGLSAPAAPPR